MVKKEEGNVALNVVGGIIVFLAVFIGLPLLLAVLGLIQLPFLGFEKKVELNHGVINQTYDTQYCLANYEWFKQTYQDIQQSDVQIANVQAQITDFKTTYGNDTTKWNFAATQQYGQVSANLTGLQNYKADLVGKYNAKTQELNRVACKDLPLFVNP